LALVAIGFNGRAASLPRRNRFARYEPAEPVATGARQRGDGEAGSERSIALS